MASPHQTYDEELFEHEVSRPRSKKHPLPEDWYPSAELHAECVKRAPDINVLSAYVEFRNYWLHKADVKDGKRTSWEAQFVEWVLKAQRWLDESRPPEVVEAAYVHGSGLPDDLPDLTPLEIAENRERIRAITRSLNQRKPPEEAAE